MIWKTVLVCICISGAYADFDKSKFDMGKEKLREQCEKNGAGDKTDEVMDGVNNFIDCIKSQIDFHNIVKEIEEAKPHGTLDEVFKTYCDKSPQFKACFHNLTSTVAPCLDQNVRSHLSEADNSVNQLIDFVCFKDGDRIALFIAEGGPECFRDKMHSINDCAKRVAASVLTPEAAQALTLNEQCSKMDEMSSCIVKSLEECSTPTPGNMVESLFRFMRNGSPCKSVAPQP